MKKKTSALIVLLALSVAVLSGCGSSDKKSEESTTTSTEQSDTASTGASDSAGGQVVEVKVSAKDWEYDQKEIRVKKGDKVKITLASDGHGFALPVYNVDIQGNGSAEFTADQAGQFEFHCSVRCGTGHMDMKGTLIVE